MAHELHKPVIKTFKKRRVHSKFKDNISIESLTEIGSLSSKNQGIRYLLCIMEVLQNMLGLNFWLIKELKQFLMVLLE